MARAGISSRGGLFVSFGTIGSIVLLVVVFEFSLVFFAIVAVMLAAVLIWALVKWQLVRHDRLPVALQRERVSGNYSYSREREARTRALLERRPADEG
jgi:hypothetical protein